MYTRMYVCAAGASAYNNPENANKLIKVYTSLIYLIILIKAKYLTDLCGESLITLVICFHFNVYTAQYIYVYRINLYIYLVICI